MPVFIDLTGRRFGRLTVMHRAPNCGLKVAWFCQCDCGGTCTPQGGSLKSGNSVSCGCVQRETAARLKRTHGLGKNPAFQVWYQMLERCENPTHVHYRHYGGRGITVCDRWHDFPSFLADMGERPTPRHQIDRKDNDGNYEPANCHWVTPRENQRNRASTHLIELDGERISLMEAAERRAVSYGAVLHRFHKGVRDTAVLLAPTRGRWA